MTVRKLNQTKWRAYCDFLSKTLEGKRAEVEAASLALGVQVQAKWLPLLGIVYDRRNDLIEIALEDVGPVLVDHMIRKPREVYVDDGPGGLLSLAITDADGVKHIVQLRDPLMLPPSPGTG